MLRSVMWLLALVILGRRLRVSGRPRFPRQGGVLVISNHIASVDPPLTGALIPRWDVHYMTKSESFRNPWTRWLFRGYHAFPVTRGSADRGALRHARELLDAGHVVLVYPEGSRATDAQLRRPHPGIGFLIRHTDAVVVPVAIAGSERVLPKGANLPHRNSIHIRYGTAFRPRDRGADGRRLSNQELADSMMWRVAEMLPPEYRGVFTSPERVASARPSAA